MKKTIVIPREQTDLIKTALKFYMDSFKTLSNSSETEEQAYRMFDMRQLNAMMDYEISITIDKDAIEMFSYMHGMDFPNYVYEYQPTCNDVDGNELKFGDKVVVIDVDDLEGDAPERGQILDVTAILDTQSNYIEFGVYSFYGHRVLKIK